MKRIICVLLFCFSLLQAENKGEEEETSAELKEWVCSSLPFIEGWCSPKKAVRLIDLVLQEKPEICVEIGVFGGSSLFPVAAALKFLGRGVVIGIDPWDKLEAVRYFDPKQDEANLKWWSRINFEYIYKSYINMVRKYELDDYCITIRTTSEKASPLLKAIDILYIDGNHSEEASTMDVALYLPKVRPGGYIWLNDALWKERQEAQDILLEACDFVDAIDGGNCVLFKKRLL